MSEATPSSAEVELALLASIGRSVRIHDRLRAAIGGVVDDALAHGERLGERHAVAKRHREHGRAEPCHLGNLPCSVYSLTQCTRNP